MDQKKYVEALGESLDDLLRSFDGRNHVKEMSITNKAPAKGSYSYIPFQPIQFLKLIDAAMKHVVLPVKKTMAKTKPMTPPKPVCRFVDAGCGIGLTVRMANLLMREEPKFKFVAEGVELQKPLVDFAKRYMAWNANIHHENIFDFDFKPYNVVYFYRPIADDKIWHEWLDYLVKTVRKGTVLISASYGWRGVNTKGKKDKVKSVYREQWGGSEVVVRV